MVITNMNNIVGYIILGIVSTVGIICMTWSTIKIFEIFVKLIKAIFK
jgi:hypothetical protein